MTPAVISRIVSALEARSFLFTEAKVTGKWWIPWAFLSKNPNWKISEVNNEQGRERHPYLPDSINI